MPWGRVPGLKGKIFIPEPAQDVSKKHGCKDCFSCQMCSDDRCRVCLGRMQTPKTCNQGRCPGNAGAKNGCQGR